MSKILKIARQEFKMTAANKAFIIITLLGPFLIMAVTVLPMVLASGPNNLPEDSRLGLVGNIDENTFSELSAWLSYFKLNLTRLKNEEEAQKAVEQGEVASFLVLPTDLFANATISYFSKTGTDVYLFEKVKSGLASYIINKRFTQAGIDPALVQKLSQQPNISIYKLSPEGKDANQDFSLIFMTALSFIMLLYMTVLLYGQLIARSVVIEKTSKTVEIMLSSVTPRQLMFGKLLGVGLAGILQYLFWISLSLILTEFLGPLLNINLHLTIKPDILFSLLIFFLTAYFLYASAYTALGAAAEDERHVGSLSLPLIIFLIIPMVLISNIIMTPDSTLVKVLSFFPLTAQLVMFARLLILPPPLEEILLSLGLSLATIFLFMAAAAKIFRVGILMTGKRVGLLEIFKWLKVK